MVDESTRKKVVTIGDFVTDVIVTIPSLPVQAGAHQLAHSISIQPGGSANFVIACARLGLDTDFLGVLGKDSFGQMAVDTLERERIDTSNLIRQPGGSTTTVMVLVDDASRHVFLGQYGQGPEVSAPARWFERLSGADAVFWSGYSLHEPRLTAAALECVRQAFGQGIPVFFDPGPHIENISAIRCAELLAMTSVLLLTEEEIPLVTGGPAGLDAAQTLLKAGLKAICVKQGEHGCTILSEDGAVSHPGFRVPVRDTNAAGDSFDAAFIYGWLRGWPLETIATFANAMGAAKVQKLGSGTNIPTLAEIQAVLNRHAVQISI